MGGMSSAFHIMLILLFPPFFCMQVSLHETEAFELAGVFLSAGDEIEAGGLY